MGGPAQEGGAERRSNGLTRLCSSGVVTTFFLALLLPDISGEL